MKKYLILLLFLNVSTFSKDKESKDILIKYKKGKDIDFDALLIEGHKRKESTTGIGGDKGLKDYSLLQNIKNDFYEEAVLDLGLNSLEEQ